MNHSTRVKVSFNIYGDQFPLDMVSLRMEMSPSYSYSKGEPVYSGSDELIRYREETVWSYSHEYQESLDVNEQLHEILYLTKGKEHVLHSIKKEYSLIFRINIAIIIEEGITPALYFHEPLIRYVHSIGAEIDVDLYANPYKDDE
ncbi:DUF4279 domain-containing protein [Paenibacillus sp. JX-17]|uniref:DUF4279 domain-containing protein n=1 Tax=Paenibacillus lacisoli TaxID=3064525 RepID=A0ABT9CHM7_9BACL|nr:DUF4279 domain-containing protein [Paenibacillus sp. JX-17]MDO7908780.1 DUF4279 domain-containing protein [Paenibacillus sp. JX-17]